MYINLRLNMIAHIIVLLYTVIVSFKHITAFNEKIVKKLFALLAFISGMWLLLNRDTYLPFLGYAVLPKSVLKDELEPSDANIDYVLPIDEKDASSVIYWASKPSKEIKENPFVAYGDYSNAGIVKVQNGLAKIKFNCPSQYKVGAGYLLKQHIHYRILFDNGLLSPIQTKYVSC